MDHSPTLALKDAQHLADDGNYTEAAAAFRVLFEQQPDSPEALGALADVMSQIGQTDSALALLADSVDAAEPDPLVLRRIADQLAGAGRLDESADFLLCAFCCTPEDPALRLRTETLLKSLGRLTQLEWLQSGAEGELPAA
jgi:thioredoxin-like negative regulator of GroEL